MFSGGASSLTNEMFSAALFIIGDEDVVCERVASAGLAESGKAETHASSGS